VNLSNPQPSSIKLLPNGNFGTCTIVQAAHAIYLPLIKKK
jgi:hypothetical protein